MDSRVVWTDEALSDLREVAEYIGRERLEGVMNFLRASERM